MNAENKTGHALVMKHTFAAPRELVFKAWTTAEMVKNWWGCSEFPASHIEMDARPGGLWRGCLRSDAGGEIRLTGKFIEIVRPERLVFTFVREPVPGLGVEPVDTQVTVVFSESNGKTVVDLRQEFFATSELCDDHRNGWTTSFGRLDKIFAA